MPETCRIAAIQMPVAADKTENLVTMMKFLREAVKEKPDFVILPEMFDCPYQNSLFPRFAEPDGGQVYQILSSCAKEYGIYLIAGSVPERAEDGSVYNTSYAFDRSGRLIGKHRKVHLFDIDAVDGSKFRESAVLSPGDHATVFDTEFGPVGVAICYDIRFPELFRIMADRGARITFLPAAFHITTGEMHWELTFRARALDNQMFFVGCEPERDPDGPFVAWGHSIITDPYGRVAAELDEHAGILCDEIDLGLVDEVRANLPLLKHRRKDLYEVVWKKTEQGE